MEFVLLFPFMMLLLLSFIEFGFALHNWILVNNSAAEAALYAAVGNLPSIAAGTCDAGSVEERAVESSAEHILCSEVTVEYQRLSASDVRRGDAVAVRIAHVYTPVTGFGAVLNLVSGGTFPSTLTLSACADSRLESNPTRTGLLEGVSC